MPGPGEQARGQLLRALPSISIQAALERHFGVGLAFQNCHRVAVFRSEAVRSRSHRDFVSEVGQLRNQSSELVNC